MRRAKITGAKKQAFLKAYAKLGNITAAARLAGIERKTHNKWLAKDPAYAEAFAEAEEQAVEAMEQEAWRRAVKGTRRPLSYKGQPTRDEHGRLNVIREYSDVLLIFLLKARRPAIYREHVNARERYATGHGWEAIRGILAGPGIPRGETYHGGGANEAAA